jgi:homopolymeric O-antigen transport system permease protein
MKYYPVSIFSMFSSLLRNKELIFALIKREVVGRYRGSLMGLAWSFFNPLLMLSIYTFVFSVVFEARWGVNAAHSKVNFALVLFVGLIIHGLFSECIEAAPVLILSNINYVKKVIFPLEILPWVIFGSALFHAIVSILVLLIAQLLLIRQIPWTVVFLPFVMLPISFAAMGAGWFLSALGVYVRDIEQLTTMMSTVLLFVSAVFYPISALPKQYQILVKINPLALTIEQGRDAMISGKIPNLEQWCLLMALGVFVAWFGFAWFQKTRKGFADVL